MTQGFSDSRVESGQWSRALSRVWSLTPLGWISICTLEAENVPVLAGMTLLEKHDFSFRRNEFLVYDAEGHTRSVPLRRSPSGHRILNLLLLGQRTASCHPVAQFCQHANLAPVNSHRMRSDFAVCPHENVCQPSFLPVKLRSIGARLSHLQTVIDGQES